MEDDEHDVTITDDEIIIHDGLDTIRWKVARLRRKFRCKTRTCDLDADMLSYTN